MLDGRFDHHVAELFAASMDKTDRDKAPGWKTATVFGICLGVMMLTSLLALA